MYWLLYLMRFSLCSVLGWDSFNKTFNKLVSVSKLSGTYKLTSTKTLWFCKEGPFIQLLSFNACRFTWFVEFSNTVTFMNWTVSLYLKEVHTISMGVWWRQWLRRQLGRREFVCEPHLPAKGPHAVCVRALYSGELEMWWYRRLSGRRGRAT